MLLHQGSIAETHENDEDDNLASLTWQEIAEQSTNIVTFESVIEEFTLVDPENEEDKLPEQLLEVANFVLSISLDIKSVRSHKEDFERLLGHASSLVVVFWQEYNKLGIPGTMWPPPYLRDVIDRLVNTVYYIYKLVKRKSQKRFAKRILVGYFGLRDIGKFKKYQRKLGSVASSFQSEPNNVNINGVLVEVIRNRAQHSIEDGDSEHSEEPAEPVGRKKRGADQEATAKRSRLRNRKAKQDEAEDSSNDEHNEENNTAKKKTTRRQPDSNETRGTNFFKKSESKGKKTRYQESDDVEEGTFRQGSRTNNAAQSKKTKARVISDSDDDEEHDADLEEPNDDLLPPKRQRSKRKNVSTPNQKAKSTPVSPQYSVSDFTFNNGRGEGTPRQGSRTKNAAQSKTKNPAYDDDEEYDAEIPVNDPPAPKGQSKKKKAASTPKQKVNSTPVSPQYSISGFTFNNDSGNMTNMNVGNIYNSAISDAYNDNSVNWRRKPA